MSDEKDIMDITPEEEDIPVQSFSDMMSGFFDDGDGEETSEEKVSEDKKESKPVPEEKPQEQKSSEPVPEEKPQEQKSSEPVPEEKSQADKKAAAEALRRREMAEDSFSAGGSPISEEEAERRSVAESALDRDLAKARKKKLQEEMYYKRRREEERKLENERLEKAKEAKERLITAADNAKRREEMKAAQAALEASMITAEQRAEAEKKAEKRRNAINNYTKRSASEARSLKAGAVLGVLLIVAYAFAYVFVNSKNDEFYSTIDPQLNAAVKVIEKDKDSYRISDKSAMTESEKDVLALCRWLPDSDKDGLSDHYEMNVTGTDPSDSDTDRDSIPDGRELRAGLDPKDPCTDGETPDCDTICDMQLHDNGITAEISGINKGAFVSLSRSANNSIQGTPGLVSSAFEFYSDKPFDRCKLIFRYDDAELEADSISAGALRVYRFDPDKLLFEGLPSVLNGEQKTVSAQIEQGGIYALCNSSILAYSGKTNIFFLIDNSGSMYPETMCAGSEENDVEFKRLDFAASLIDRLGKNASYGAGEFSGSYEQIVPISADSKTVKDKINSIRDKEQIFSGTEIAGAINAAVAEFGEINRGDRNYIILLTDGMPSVYNDAADRQAIAMAADRNITVFTIGLGKQIDTRYLYNISQQTNGQFFQASNADALESLCSKIESFMSYNYVTIEEEESRKGYILADSGFNVAKDGIGYSNFRADFAPDGADMGIAGLIRAYYTGDLQLSQGSYTAKGGSIDGYDVSGIKAFGDKKTDLADIKMDILYSYKAYLDMPEKWNYRGIKNNVLHYTEEARDFIDGHKLRVMTADYSFKFPEPDPVVDFLRVLTFSKIKPFETYERVIVDSAACEGDDKAIMGMIKWFNSLPDSGSCEIYDFGYDGNETFNRLVNELTVGSPAVIVCGGNAMNAIRLLRDAEDPNLFILDAYDCNSPDRVTKIRLTRSPVYDNGSGGQYQYSASLGNVDKSLQLIIEK